jgi:hypothetical protein
VLSTKTNGRDKLTIAFIAVTLILLAVTVNYTVNYYRYYPALTQVKLSITSFQKTTSTDSQGNPALKITVKFQLENPSQYYGFIMKSFQSTLDVIGNITAPQGVLPYNAATGPLNPGDTINIGYSGFDVTAQAAKLAASSQTTQFVFYPNFVLSSFLDRATLVIPTYQCSSTGGPVTCLQTGLTLQTASGGFGNSGGGGGA